ncbi:hypothetical protein OF83DRAFT_1274794 [Amylostereum chailletii]|nr:hypothetical protein OF83DRAFT_1274794 [Amylostereum chailletii]
MSSSVSVHLSPASEAELRHVVSNGALALQKDSRIDPKLLNRPPQPLSHRLGSLSPASMPSSPTSVHSSSSAIFERDIEPISLPSSQTSHPPNPHRIPRGKATEQLDHAVPSVLDSAAAVLASSDDSISVVAPALPSPELTSSRSGVASPVSRMSSRSPSPAPGRMRALPSPSPSLVQTQPSAASTATNESGPRLPGAYIPTPISTSPPPEPSSPLQSISPNTSGLSHPPSPHAAAKRLSFLSYTDLLSSAPSSTVPLSSLTTAATAMDPPPHLPSVLGLPQQHVGSSAGGSTRSSWYADLRDVREGREGLFVEEAGGEWEREGLGQGLEERLESLMGMNQVSQVGLSKA